MKNSELQKLRTQIIEQTKEALRNSTSPDHLIIQSINTVMELDKVTNTLSTRLREWYSLYYPELERKIGDHKKFAELVLKEERAEDSFGSILAKEDLDAIKQLADNILQLIQARYEQEQYLKVVMKKHCPNILSLAGVTIGAKLIDLGRSLKRLALLPASTIQLLGAEKALFRHLKTGARSPKYGILFEHQIIQKAQRKNRGKAARMLADKLSLCARLDFFKGEFKADQYEKEIEEKLEL